MSWKDLSDKTEYQSELVTKHIAKAEQCMEYGRTDDATVHLTIAGILHSGVKAKMYEQEALDNTAQAVA